MPIPNELRDLTLENSACRRQTQVRLCPAKVYEKNEETGECIFHFENCLECGTCQVVNRKFVV